LVSLEPPPVKMSSLVVLTASLMNAPASARLVGPLVKLFVLGTVVGEPPSAKIWSQSCVGAVWVRLPSSSNGVGGLTLGVTRPAGGSSQSGYRRRRRGERFGWDRFRKRFLNRWRNVAVMVWASGGRTCA